jgi:hypothetical protein
MSKRSRIFIGHAAHLCGGHGLCAVPRGGRTGPALPRVGRRIPGGNLANPGHAGGTGRARRRHRPARLEPVQGSLCARIRCADLQCHKARVELRVYVADRQGSVVYDSTGQSLGKDFSQWRDVRLTLQGEYGARTTLDLPGDPDSAVMYVAAPVRWTGQAVARSSAASPWANRCRVLASLWPPRAAARCMQACSRWWPCWC